MAAVMYDSAWPTSAEAFRLCRLLGNDYADALPPRLWAWGIETDNEKGVFEADAKQLARIVRFDGDCDALLAAFVSCDVIEPTEKPHEYRIRGWDRNKRLFSERKRLRNLRKHQKRTRTHTRTRRVQNALPVAHVSSSSSSSSSSSKANTGGEAPPQKIETLRDAQALSVTDSQGRKVFEHWQAEMERVHQTARMIIAPPARIEDGKRVVVNAGGDMELAFRVVTAFVESTHKYWVDRGRALWLMAKPEDFEQARLATPQAPLEDPEPKPWDENWPAWNERQKAKKSC